MSPTSYQAALPRVIPSLLSATLIIIPYSNSFVKRVRKVFLQQKQRMKTRLLTFFPESQQPRQFTPLREGRRRLPCDSGSTFKFQFTPLREGRPIPGRNSAAPIIFQFTPLREGRRCLPRLPQAPCYFNSRPSARGDGRKIPSINRARAFQFTPLREGRPESGIYHRKASYFNSRPSARGDNYAPCEAGEKRYFNSRPSARGDAYRWAYRPSCPISIHAPPRGATVFHPVLDVWRVISIHAPPRGATYHNCKANGLTWQFQFTPLREGRRHCFQRSQRLLYFNSRPSARGDVLLLSFQGKIKTFQFTPLREGRPFSL